MGNGFNQQALSLIYPCFLLPLIQHQHSMLNVIVQFLYGLEKTLVVEKGMYLCD